MTDLGTVIDELLPQIGTNEGALLAPQEPLAELQARLEGIPIVYLLWNERAGLFKIGQTRHIRQRMKTLSSEEGCELELWSYRASFDRPLRVTKDEVRHVERSMHDRFSHYRVRGEWFLPAPEICEAFGLGGYE